LTNPSNNRYYILDALGHTRLLLDNTGNVTDTYVYDAWGNLLKGSEFNTPNPFTWNGAYGYEWIEFTGLFHVGAREYDPRTARWLQRDPIGVGGGDPNLYRYCFNRPIMWADPSGLQIVIYVHGTMSNDKTFTKDFIKVSSTTLGAKAHFTYNWSGSIAVSDIKGCAAEDFSQYLNDLKDNHPGELIYVVAHSNGGNVAVAAAQQGAPIDLIIRLGSPPVGDLNWVNENTTVFDVYDPKDTVAFGAGGLSGGSLKLAPAQTNWHHIKVDAPCSFWSRHGPGADTRMGISKHTNMHSSKVWKKVEPYLKDWLKGRGRR
jgi:RHS repeat-associated protein